LLLFLLAGLFLLRFDTRTLCGLLFHDPPRRTNPALLPQKARCSNSCARSFQVLPCSA
jgi:hypothetical protein